jgi:hypothetical protein
MPVPPAAGPEPKPKSVEVLKVDVYGPELKLDLKSPKDSPEWETVSKVLDIPGSVAVTVAELVPVGTRVISLSEVDATVKVVRPVTELVQDAPVAELEPKLEPEPELEDAVEPLLVPEDIAAVAPEGVVVAKAVEECPAGSVVDSLAPELVLSPAPPPLPLGKEELIPVKVELLLLAAAGVVLSPAPPPLLLGKEKLIPVKVELLLLVDPSIVTSELEVDDGTGVLEEANDDDDGQLHGQQKLGNTGSEVAQSPKLSERSREMSFFSNSTSPKSWSSLLVRKLLGSNGLKRSKLSMAFSRL